MKEATSERSRAHMLQGKVLIVEDEEFMGKWLQKKLMSAGIDATWVQDTKTAQEALATQRFHALVTDICFDNSKQAGLELIKSISSQGLPTIVITSKADLDIAKSCLNYGVSQFLEKPFDAQELIAKIEDIWEFPRNLTSLMERYLDIHDLTEKEKQIARFALKGLSNREIAELNGNTEKTVKFHMTIIFDKCGVKSRAELFNAVFPT